jgi:ATP-dependent exoDNAse (exonuclease V) alpha subunit
MVLEVARAERALGLQRGEYSVRKVDDRKELVELRDGRGRLHRLKPSRIGRTGKDNNMTLFDRRTLDLHKGDRIRWTRNDHRRGLFNADQAKVTHIDERHVTIQTSKGMEQRLGKEDPMLKRVDLAYALNAHMAQGLTSDRGIAVMDSRERNLANQKTFLVTVTRLRDQLTLVVDSAAKLGAAVSRNRGEKSSALEVTERLKAAAQVGVSKTAPEQVSKASEKELAKERTRNIDFSI